MRTSLSYWWNIGSIMGIVLLWQIIRGLFLVLFYTCDAIEALSSVEYIIREVNNGWIVRVSHFNGARLFFLLLYLHMSRGIILGRFHLWKVWSRGIIILICIMGEAFIGYVLPWGQISVWGACVITRLFSVFPWVGEDLVVWIWGGLVVNRATLGCLLILHYLLPFIILIIIILHILFLHELGRTSSCGGRDRELKVKFWPTFIFKDRVNIIIWSIFLVFICLWPWFLGDCENFKEANLIRRPVHIQPEWYFLFLYAILRAVPNKLGGVLLLALSLFIIWLLCLLPYNWQSNSLKLNTLILRILIVLVVVLTLLGCSPVETPLTIISQEFTRCYLILLAATTLLGWTMW